MVVMMMTKEERSSYVIHTFVHSVREYMRVIISRERERERVRERSLMRATKLGAKSERRKEEGERRRAECVVHVCILPSHGLHVSDNKMSVFLAPFKRLIGHTEIKSSGDEQQQKALSSLSFALMNFFSLSALNLPLQWSGEACMTAFSNQIDQWKKAPLIRESN
jgi:hypothetical protein